MAEGPVATHESPVTLTAAEFSPFPDSHLTKAVAESLGKSRYTFTTAELSGLKVLEARGKGISDLSGIEACRELVRLNLDHNRIRDLSPLNRLSNLVNLSLTDNEITDLSPLRGIRGLKYLFVADNQVSDLNVLASLSELRSVDLRGNVVQDISPLASLSKVRYLLLAGNAIRDVAAFGVAGAFSSGTTIDLRANPLEEHALLIEIPRLQLRGLRVRHGPDFPVRFLVFCALGGILALSAAVMISRQFGYTLVGLIRAIGHVWQRTIHPWKPRRIHLTPRSLLADQLRRGGHNGLAWSMGRQNPCRKHRRAVGRVHVRLRLEEALPGEV